MSRRRVQSEAADYDNPIGNLEKDAGGAEEEEEEHIMKVRASDSKVSEDQEPFFGVKVRRKASILRDYRGDYLQVASTPFLFNLIQKQGLFFFFSCFYTTLVASIL